MIDYTALFIVFGSLLTGAVFVGLPVGYAFGQNKILRELVDDAGHDDILDAEEIS